MFNLIMAFVGLVVFVVFSLRAAGDFGFRWEWKIPLPFGEFSQKTEQKYEGGNGGNATVSGSGTAIGGPGGAAGPYGSGGAGGDAVVNGNGFAAGGEGGEAGQLDRGGRGGRNGYEAAGLPNFQLPDGTWIYDYGRGGDGSDPINSDKK